MASIGMLLPSLHPDAKTVIYFHGNGEVVADYLPSFPEWITRAGCNVLLAEYRGYGMSSGTPALQVCWTMLSQSSKA